MVTYCLSIYSIYMLPQASFQLGFPCIWSALQALWSMLGYLVGLGDRHGENILLDTDSGRLPWTAHLWDFNMFKYVQSVFMVDMRRHVNGQWHEMHGQAGSLTAWSHPPHRLVHVDFDCLFGKGAPAQVFARRKKHEETFSKLSMFFIEHLEPHHRKNCCYMLLHTVIIPVSYLNNLKHYLMQWLFVRPAVGTTRNGTLPFDPELCCCRDLISFGKSLDSNVVWYEIII